MGYTTDDPDAERALRSPAARRIFDEVGTAPGASLSELRRVTGFGWGTIYHHLARLARAGLVTMQKRGRHRCVFPRGLDGEPARTTRHHGRTRRRVAAAIREEGPATIDVIVARTGLSRRVVYHHAKRLIDEGLVARSFEDHTLHALPDLARVLRD